MASLGGPITDKALVGLTGLASALSATAQFFDKNPKAADLAANATIDAAAGLTVVGALMMTKFAKSAFGWLMPAGSGAAGGGLFSSIGAGLRGGAIGLAIDIVAHQVTDALLLPKQQSQIRDALSAIPGIWPITDMFFRAPEHENWLPQGGWPLGALTGAGPANRITRDALPYLRNQDLQGIGAEYGLGVAPMVTGALGRMPGAVNPAITSAFASITGALVGAINGMAASAARAAASAATVGASIPSGGGKTITLHTAINMDSRPVAKAVTTAIMNENRTAMSTGRFDGSSMSTPTDYAFT